MSTTTISDLTDLTNLGGATSSLTAQEAIDLCVESMAIVARGDLADFERIVHPAAVNHEARSEPPGAREPGPRGFHATALWLRGAFAELAFEVHEAVAMGDLVVVHDTMSGRQVGPMVSYDANGSVAEVFPPRGRRFASTQTHWFRLSGGLVIEHWANRDDLATARQLGWVPPSPTYLFRMARARRRARRAAA
jgi:predicted ester cyclase